MVEVGQQAPDIQLIDTGKNPMKISDFKGKPTVLLFFPGAFTGTCTKEMCAFRDSMSKYNDLNANVVGISVDSPFSNKAFKENNKLDFTVLSDYGRQAVRLYNVVLENFAGLKDYTAAKRSVFILDKNGVIKWKWVSDDPGKEPDYAQVQRETEKVGA